MNSRIISSLFASSLLVILFASGASGQAQRTFISGLGNDGNPCSRTSPCRTFGQAIMGTNAGGEVIVLDSAGYGPVNINKSISIIASPGAYAGISVFSGAGLIVNAGANDTVILRGLTVNSQGGDNGIQFNSSGTLQVENCVVNGFVGGNGLLSTAGGKLAVKDSIFRSNSFGISISGTSAVAVDHVLFEANTTGLTAQNGPRVTVCNSVAFHNDTAFFAFSGTTANVDLTIESCVVSNNTGAGMFSQSNSTGVATVRVSNSTVTDNATGLANNGAPALLLSRGNNTVEGNTTNNTFGTIGSYSAK
jgi:hypothetical protein